MIRPEDSSKFPSEPSRQSMVGEVMCEQKCAEEGCDKLEEVAINIDRKIGSEEGGATHVIVSKGGNERSESYNGDSIGRAH